jgi:hypothetical protein
VSLKDRTFDRVAPGDDVPTTYKLWVFGSKLAGVGVFTVGVEMIVRGHLAWAALLMVAGAAIVVAPVRGPRAWHRG